MRDFKRQYRNLEVAVLSELRDKINSSKTSKFGDFKAISVNLKNFVELAIINNSLTFICGNGNYYSIWDNSSLEDLIDILE